MNFWNNFAAKHPAAAKWVREGGLFVIVSNLITVFKYLLLQFLPKAFASLPVVDFGFSPSVRRNCAIAASCPL